MSRDAVCKPLASDTQNMPKSSSTARMGVSVVIPCFNEEIALLHLRDRLLAMLEVLRESYDIHLVFVDDGSTDGTWSLLNRLFDAHPKCTLIRQTGNLGLGAAILAGLKAATTEIVCSIDADCTYDPCQLDRLLPMLTSGVDLVTGSPHHPGGSVVGVPRWRLFLSKSASFLYRFVLRQELYTYTSCFRVYRRGAVLKLELKRRDFLAVAELIGKLDLQGSAVVECPTTLTCRAHGVSKMKIARVLAGHLGLLLELITLRVQQAFSGRTYTS